MFKYFIHFLYVYIHLINIQLYNLIINKYHRLFRLSLVLTFKKVVYVLK